MSEDLNMDAQAFASAPNPLDDIKDEFLSALAMEQGVEPEDVQEQEEITDETQVEENPVEQETPTMEDEAETGVVENESEVSTEESDNTDDDYDIVDIDDYIKDSFGGEFENFESLQEELNRLRESVGESREPEFKDDFIKGVVEYYEKTGDLTEYLTATLLDYDEMSSEDILRQELREQYPTLSDAAFNRVFQDQVMSKFNLDENRYSEEDVNIGKELLDAEASKIRERFKQDQQQFINTASKKQVDHEAEAQALQAQQEQQFREWEENINNDAATQELLNSRLITVDNGNGDQFRYEVKDVSELVESTLDNQRFFEQFMTKDGLDLNKWYRVLSYAQDPQAFEKSLIAHGRTLGEKRVAKELKNPSKPVKEQPSTTPDGSNPMQILEAFAKLKG